MRFSVLLTTSNDYQMVSLPWEPSFIVISNPTGSAILVREGGVERPSVSNADYTIQAGGLATLPVIASSFGVSFSDKTLVATSSNPTASARVTFYDNTEAVPNIGSIQPVAKPAPYDRNPKNIFIVYTAGLGPHGMTVRANYTCPTNRKGFIELLYLEVQRSGVPSPQAFPRALNYARAQYSPVNNPFFTIFMARMTSTLSGEFISANIPNVFTMLSGDAISLQTEDDNVNGDATYYLNAKIMEFDP